MRFQPATSAAVTTRKAEGMTAEIIDATCSHDNCARKDTYRVEVQCVNCGWEGQQRVTCGHVPRVGRSIGRPCPRCEVNWLQKGGFAMKSTTGPPRVCPSCKSPYWDRPRIRQRKEGPRGKTPVSTK